LKNHCIHLLNYDHWANQKLLEHMNSIPEEIFHSQTNSVFPTIGDTFFHIFNAQRIWFVRCIPHLFPDESLKGFQDVRQAKETFFTFHKSMIEQIQLNYDELDEIIYQNSKGITYKNHINEIIHHLANHGTYHRGNIVAMIRGFGCKGTSTDYIEYMREVANSK
jgi:uncharacterized damage-inducible protein DinB